MSTRRQLFRTMLASAASLPFAALAQTTGGDKNDGRGTQGYNDRGYGYGTSKGTSSSYSGDGSARGSAGCLLKGTKISTPSGERPVEDLAIGDEVQTLSGQKAIKWIGYDKFTKSPERRWHRSVMPIRLERRAIDDYAPHNTLFLSPLHCILVNENLIPIKYLVNGTSIVQRAPIDLSAIEYYHIDLGTHEVIFAEGAWVESFWDGVSGRESFANFVEYERLYGAEPPKMKPFAPILDYHSRAERITGAARDLISNVVDVRDQIQVVRDQLARRAEALFV